MANQPNPSSGSLRKTGYGYADTVVKLAGAGFHDWRDLTYAEAKALSEAIDRREKEQQADLLVLLLAAVTPGTDTKAILDTLTHG